MNIGRSVPLILAGWLFSGMALAIANARLSDASFEDWTGVLREVELQDGSALFEYTARTFSGSTEGAMLAISYLPRFDCAPMINVRMASADDQAALDNPLVEITVDGQQHDFPAIVDNDNNFVVYAVAAPAAKVEELVKIINVSSRARFIVRSSEGQAVEGQKTSNARSSGRPAIGNSAAFSLIGSQLTTQSVKKHCQSHEPLAYDPG